LAQIGQAASDSPPFRKIAPSAIRLRSDQETIVIDGKSFEWALDKKTGAIRRAAIYGVPFVAGGPVLMPAIPLRVATSAALAPADRITLSGT